MPLYDFACPAGHVQETFERASAVKQTMACEVCGKRAKRVLSAPAPHRFDTSFNEGAGMAFDSPEDKRRKLAAKGLAEAPPGHRDKRGRLYSYAGQTNRGGNSLPHLN